MYNTFYKVRDRKTGLFRTSGLWAKWTKDGHTWSSIGHVKQHFSQFPADKIDWDNWEVVEYVYEPKEAGATILKDLLT